jgi:hypothetical protein
MDDSIAINWKYWHKLFPDVSTVWKNGKVGLFGLVIHSCGDGDVFEFWRRK